MTTINLLDPSQKYVLESLIDGGQDLNVVYGPPGTGKSHLIVSLLFELATRGQKVLFVSQNVEALDVISRMITSLEKQFRLGSSHLSLLDFCWRLTDSQQRRLAWVKDLRSRLNAKTGTERTSVETVESEFTPPYQLTYTHLDHLQNENISDDTPLGLDEVLAAKWHFADFALTPEPVKKVNHIPIRQVFRLLYSYEKTGPTANFAEFFQPHDELRFLQSTHDGLDLTTIRSQAQAIAQALAALPATLTQAVSSQDNIDSSAFIDILAKLTPLTAYLDLAKITPQIAIDISDHLHAAAQAWQEKEAVLELTLSPEQDLLLTDLLTDTVLADRAHFQAAQVHWQQLPELTKQLTSAGISEEQNWAPLAGNLWAATQLTTLLTDFPGLTEFTATQLAELLEVLRAWQHQGRWRKLFTKPPLILRQTKAKISRDDVDRLVQHEQLFVDAQACLHDTDWTLAELASLTTFAQSTTAWDPLQNVTIAPEKLRCLIVQFLAHLATPKLSDIPTDLSFGELARLAETWSQQAISLQDLITHHQKLATRLSLAAFCDGVNAAVRQRRRDEIITAAQAFLTPYWRGPTVDAQTICAAAALVADLDLSSLLVHLHWSPAQEEITVPAATWEKIRTALQTSLQTGMLADCFYQLTPGQTLSDVIERATSLQHWQNITRFDDFLTHWDFLHQLASWLGTDNMENVNRFLTDSPDFFSLAARITLDLSTAFFQSLPATARRVMSDDYFTQFAATSYRDRRDYYLAGLAKLYDRVYAPAGLLKKASSWPTGRGVMEKLRANTELLTQAYPIIIATPKEVAKYLSATKEIFDTVVFDEASQTLPGQALPSLYRAKRGIIVGDPHQMPSTLTTSFGYTGHQLEEDELSDSVSILDLAIQAQTDRAYHLKVHYRSESNLLFEPSRQAIYADYGIQPLFEACSASMPLAIHDDLGADDRANFAQIIKVIQQKLQSDPESSFCLLFTRRQDIGEKEFRHYLASDPTASHVLYPLLEKERLLLSTVTNCQGIEADHAIIYFNYYKSPAATWFFKEQAGAYKRLNVAITRQRRSLTILMANPQSAWLTAAGKYHDLLSSPNAAKSGELMLSLLNYTGQVVDADYLESILGDHLETITSPLAKALYERLSDTFAKQIQAGELRLWTDIGWPMSVGAQDKRQNLSGFRLDLGLFAPQQGRFILGIECDSSVYHDGTSLDFVDEGRRNTLARKDWQLYRVWSSNWLADTQGEWQRLVRLIQEELTPKTSPPSLVTLPP